VHGIVRELLQRKPFPFLSEQTRRLPLGQPASRPLIADLIEQRLMLVALQRLPVEPGSGRGRGIS
jgi:hypothetical protein